MSDSNWPAPTPRDELLARVAARGNRIRAVRGAVNALVILSVVGASALGVGAAVDALGSDPGTELETIALPSDPPGRDDPTVPPEVTAGTGDTSDTTASGPGSTGVPGSTTSVDGAGTTDPTVGTGSGGRGPSTGSPSTAPSTRPTTTAPATTAPATGSSAEPPATTEPVTTTTETPAPKVGRMRPKVDGDVPTGGQLCSAATAEVAVEVEDANVVTLAWSQAGARRDANMSPDNSEWSAVVPLLDAGSPAGEGEVTLTVTATGPGGTTISRQSIAVTDCPAP